MNLPSRAPAGAATLCIALSAMSLASQANAQSVSQASKAVQPTVVRTPAPPTAPAPAPAAVPVTPPAVGPAPATAAQVKIPEGTEVRIAIDESLTSKTASVGDVFAFRTIEAIRLPDGTLLPEGYRGRGEVTDVEKKGMLGKAGQLNIRLNYLNIGGVRVHLRQAAAAQGKSGVGATVALSLIVSPLFLMHHGAEAQIPKGRPMTAYVDEDAMVANSPPLPNAT
jgi:hypothetical protein